MANVELVSKTVPNEDYFYRKLAEIGESHDFKRDVTVEELMIYVARVSSSRDNKLEDYEGLLNYLIEEGHWCYDSQTEILTEEGWIKFPNLDKSYKVASFNKNNRKIHFEYPSKVLHRQYDGIMHYYKGQQIDLKVTPNHRIAYREHTNEGKSDIKIKKSKNLDRKWIDLIKCGNIRKSSTHTDINTMGLNRDIYFKLCGFFIGDGTISRTGANTLRFNIRKDRECSFLNQLVKESDHLEISGNLGSECISVKLHDISFHFEKFYNDNNEKVIPKNWIRLNKSDSKNLIKGLIASDGGYKRDTIRYDTTSKTLVDRLVALYSLHNYAPTVVKRRSREDYHKQRYRVHFSQRRFPTFSTSKNRRINTDLNKEEYSGSIHCCSVSSGLVVIRRNGKVLISGNSPFQMADMTVEIETSRAIGRQLIRHRSFKFQEFSQRYSSDIKFENIELRGQPENNRQSSSEKVNPELYDPFTGLRENARDSVDVLLQVINGMYDRFIESGVASETARMILPECTRTTLYMKGSIRSWIHYLELRSKENTQKEHRKVANEIGKIFQSEFPVTSNALDFNYG